MKNWDHYLSESFKYVPQPFYHSLRSLLNRTSCLAPGGWAEIQDMDFAAFLDDNCVPQDNAMYRWHWLICEGASNANMNMRMSPATLKAKFENAGFTNIQVVNKKIPMAPSGQDQKLREIGNFQLINFLEGLEAFSLAIFCRYLGWSIEKVQLFLVQVRKDVMRYRTSHWYWPL